MDILFHLVLSISFYLIAILFEKLIGPHLEKDEPPLLKHKVPLIGHVLGLIYYGPNYYTSVAEKDRPPIFTLGIFGTRSYVVNTSQIISSIQKNAKTLSFAPLIPYVAERIAGLRAELCRTWFIDDGTYTKGMGAEHAKLIHHTLYTIDGSVDVNAAVLAELKPLMDEIPSWGDKFGIYKWMIHVISQTSFGAVYGPDHPMNDPEVEKAFWEFENNAGSLLTSAVPWLTARTAWNGRKKLAAGFLKYYKSGNKQASNFVSMRRKLFEDNGFRIEDIAQFEAGMSTPILSNTAPALFWLIREIYSRKSLLEDIRKEIQAVITTGVDDNKEPQYTLEVAKLKKECPLLIAAYHEILRLNGIGTSARRVLQDTVLDNQYLVKKDTLVLMPFSPVHQETNAWGTNAKEFDITRHLGKENRRPAVTFRSFGGAPHLCPGRQIATLEILCIAAMLIARYDVEPTLGYWTNPKLTYTMSGIATPSHDFDVSMKPLPGTEGNWNYRMGDVKLKFPLASN